MFELRLNLSAVCGSLALACLTLAGCRADRSSPAVDSGTSAPVVTMPAAPTNVTAKSGTMQVSLTWSASSGATGYHVKRATTSGGPYTQMAAPTATAYSDTAVTPGTAYYYVVSALDSDGESPNSAQALATPTATASAPSAPTQVTATADIGQVSLSWSASSGATGYHVKRSTTSGGPYTQIAAPTSTSYVDSAVTAGMAYYYVVSAVNSTGESANSVQALATPTPAASAPSAPSKVTAMADSGQVSLSWSASSGATGYHVKRSTTSGGPYPQIAAPTSTSYVDSTVTPGMAYYYVVAAVNSTGESANSSQASATPTAPVTPSVGTWINVTPANENLSEGFSSGCQNAGSRSVQADPMHASNLYTKFDCQGIWKSTDYGQTWTGPINAGANAATVSDCEGGIYISPTSTANVPTIYQACIRGSGVGFWKSVDGGVTWTRYNIAPSGPRQDYQPPVVDPYDQNHLVMTGHEQDFIVESVDGGQNWTQIPMAGAMNGNTGFLSFIDTGNASTTRGNFIWIGGGAWRTTNSGTTWTEVDSIGHLGGASQIYQPNTSGVVYMAGGYSALGFGVLRSTDFGQTWTHVGENNNENLVAGTSKYVYSLGGITGPVFELAPQPGTAGWVSSNMPSSINTQPAQIAVVNDGTHNILLVSMWDSGVWRYVEP